MSIKRLNYLEVPLSLRQRRAGEVQAQLRGLLSDPSTTPGQREFAQKQLGVINKWASGHLPTAVEGAINYQAVSEASDLAKAAALEE